MKALIYTGPEKVIYTDASDPEPRPEEALVRVDSGEFVVQTCTHFWVMMKEDRLH